MKKILSQSLLIFFYCNFFIAACAATLVYETYYLFHLAGSYWLALLVFLCTLNIYTFHYYLKCAKSGEDDRINWYRKHKPWIWILLFAGSCAIIYLLILHYRTLFSQQNIFWTLLIPFLSIAYSFPFLPHGKALRHFGWLKLPLLSFVWSFTTVLLPLLYAGYSSFDQTQVWILFTNRFLFIMALCVLFNLRDYEEDKADHVITPAVLLGPGKVLTTGKWLMTILNFIAALLLIRSFHFHTLVQYTAVLLPIALLFLLFQFFSFTKNEIQFLLLNDGLMPVKALLLIFAAGIS